MSKVQIDNLVLFGKVWGFLKYHHPVVTSGRKDWDAELLRILPGVLAASDAAAVQDVLSKWIDDLGPIAGCAPCAQAVAVDAYLQPPLNWIADERSLGKRLSDRLRNIHRNRVPGQQYYVSLKPFVQNPGFDHEDAYAEVALPEPGRRLLALFRFWNIVEYWYPNRGVIGEDWDGVLRRLVPTFVSAKSRLDYQLALLQLIASLHDTHANLWSSLDALPPRGKCGLPVSVRFIGNDAVIWRLADKDKTLLHVGDVVEAIDGKSVAQIVTERKPYYAASNETVLLRDMGGYMTRGDCAVAALKIRREKETLAIAVPREAEFHGAIRQHDLPGATFRLLSKDVAYLKLSSVKAADVETYLKEAAGTKGLVVDIRNYPAEFVVFALGNLLVDRNTPFARFTCGDLSNPGTFVWTPPQSLAPPASQTPMQLVELPHPAYAGKIVVLIDEMSQSQSEYTAMALRATPNAKIIGSTTAGADGNVSSIDLPGGMKTMISGIGVFYPDKRPTQRIGIVPDVEVKPTIQGIRDGRDEILDAAIRDIVGKPLSDPDVKAMYTAVP